MDTEGSPNDILRKGCAMPSGIGALLLVSTDLSGLALMSNGFYPGGEELGGEEMRGFDAIPR
jgi:hypothetical protein